MSLDLGNITLTGTAEERTWRTTIETPKEGRADPLAVYHLIHFREIILLDADGNVSGVIRDEDEAAARGYPQFVARRKFTASQAVAKNADILGDITALLEELVVDAKAAENP